ncbi:kinase-like protein [Gigaspora margarita]|uniref:Kinase-like protein n=1 Tax=Gigaspora margarita TaxID=4874 RepID=A0A8H4EQW7_GIGMA|nr:kinase-like protein [Gigaspora margarita]
MFSYDHNFIFSLQFLAVSNNQLKFNHYNNLIENSDYNLASNTDEFGSACRILNVNNICAPEKVTCAFENVTVSFRDGIKMHKDKKYNDAWKCFKQHAKLNNSLAKVWLGYYLFYGYHGEKDLIQARKLFKEAADKYNHCESQLRYAAESQFRYALLLLGDLRKESNETMKDKLYKEILHYMELAAGNSENSSDDAMYYLGYIYVFGKLGVNRNEGRGIKYLRRAARNDNYRAVALLAKLENGEVPLILFDKGIKMHKRKNYYGAWVCFNRLAEFNHPLAKVWLGYYLLYGHYHRKKDPIRARQLFKEVADKHNHSEAQCQYAFLLIDDIKKVTNEPEKGNLYKEILYYLGLAAENSENPCDIAMYYLGYIYVAGKLRVRRDKERGIKYLVKASSNNNDRAIALLAKLEFADYPEFEEEIYDEEVVPVISLKDGIEMHKAKNYKSAWKCFKQNAELNNPVEKFWVGYYLLYGYHGEKVPIQARKYFKEAADEHNHSESQCRYAVLLLGDLGKLTDETAKNILRKEIVYYFELAAENPDNRNADAMYYLGDIYTAGILKVKKDEERGVYYLKLAANNKNERAIALLKKLGK